MTHKRDARTPLVFQASAQQLVGIPRSFVLKSKSMSVAVMRVRMRILTATHELTFYGWSA